MIILILVLLFKFISDMGVNYNKELLCCTKKYSLWGMGFFVAMVIVGGIVYSFNNPDGMAENKFVFDIEYVWDFAMYTGYSGTLSVFNLLVKGFAAVLFEQTVQCALYISLVCAVITCISFGMILNKIAEEKAADRSFLLLMCAPVSYLIFMPAPYAMFTAMFAMFTALIVYEKRGAALIPAVIGCLAHVNGILLLILWIIFMWVYTEERFRYVVLLATTCLFQIAMLVVGTLKGWGTMEEHIFTLAIPVILLNSRFKWILNNNIYKIVIVIFALCSGFFMCRNIYVAV